MSSCLKSNSSWFPVSPTNIAPIDTDVTHLQFERHPHQQPIQHWEYPGDLRQPLVTKTVSGFMNFVTTVGNTVMVFTPQLGLHASRQVATQTGRLEYAQFVQRSHDQSSIVNFGHFRPELFRSKSKTFLI